MKSVRNFFTLIAVWFPAIMYMAAIIWMSSRSNPIPGLSLAGGMDKVAHAIAYSVLSFFISFAIRNTWKPSHSRLFLYSAVFTTVFGIFDEIHQSFVPGRHACIWDVVADATGAVMGAGFFIFLDRINKRKKTSVIPVVE